MARDIKHDGVGLLRTVQKERYLRKIRPRPSYRPHRKPSDGQKKPTPKKRTDPAPPVDPRVLLAQAIKNYKAPLAVGTPTFSITGKSALADPELIDFADRFTQTWLEQVHLAGGATTSEQQDEVFELAYNSLRSHLNTS